MDTWDTKGKGATTAKLAVAQKQRPGRPCSRAILAARPSLVHGAVTAWGPSHGFSLLESGKLNGARFMGTTEKDPNESLGSPSTVQGPLTAGHCSLRVSAATVHHLHHSWAHRGPLIHSAQGSAHQPPHGSPATRQLSGCTAHTPSSRELLASDTCLWVPGLPLPVE